mmetsp:Transcript_13512/g.43287  ORF Transcript_13512/g.43287 Transcript_13512/m.43287 type:complete len:466 (-) Transcript_13512:282-1679(-)
MSGHAARQTREGGGPRRRARPWNRRRAGPPGESPALGARRAAAGRSDAASDGRLGDLDARLCDDGVLLGEGHGEGGGAEDEASDAEPKARLCESGGLVVVAVVVVELLLEGADLGLGVVELLGGRESVRVDLLDRFENLLPLVVAVALALAREEPGLHPLFLAGCFLCEGGLVVGLEEEGLHCLGPFHLVQGRLGVAHELLRHLDEAVLHSDRLPDLGRDHHLDEGLCCRRGVGRPRGVVLGEVDVGRHDDRVRVLAFDAVQIDALEGVRRVLWVDVASVDGKFRRVLDALRGWDDVLAVVVLQGDRCEACVVPVPVVDVADGVGPTLQVLAHAARPLLANAGRPVALGLVLPELLVAAQGPTGWRCLLEVLGEARRRGRALDTMGYEDLGGGRHARVLLDDALVVPAGDRAHVDLAQRAGVEVELAVVAELALRDGVEDADGADRYRHVQHRAVRLLEGVEVVL